MQLNVGLTDFSTQVLRPSYGTERSPNINYTPGI
jgi:hypothetical protein